jgi:hypothetical protein
VTTLLSGWAEFAVGITNKMSRSCGFLVISFLEGFRFEHFHDPHKMAWLSYREMMPLLEMKED